MRIFRQELKMRAARFAQHPCQEQGLAEDTCSLRVRVSVTSRMSNVKQCNTNRAMVESRFTREAFTVPEINKNGSAQKVFAVALARVLCTAALYKGVCVYACRYTDWLALSLSLSLCIHI